MSYNATEVLKSSQISW